jgi:hypothetical protein
MNKLMMLSLAFMLGTSSLAQAKSVSPVSLEYEVPENIAAGDVVTTMVRLTANKDLSNLSVTAVAYSGLLLVSSSDATLFSKLKRGDSREIEMSIQLDNSLGYVALHIASTDTRSREQYQSLSLRFGSPSEASLRGKKSRDVIVDSSGQRIFLMQGAIN